MTCGCSTFWPTCACGHGGNSHVPMQRALLLRPPVVAAQVAAAIVFLSSSASSFITGVQLPVDGGAVLGYWLNDPVNVRPPLIFCYAVQPGAAADPTKQQGCARLFALR